MFLQVPRARIIRSQNAAATGLVPVGDLLMNGLVQRSVTTIESDHVTVIRTVQNSHCVARNKKGIEVEIFTGE